MVLDALSATVAGEPQPMKPGLPRFPIPGLDSYFGGKGGQVAVRRIINALPPHRVFIEPFLGSGRILRTKRPADLANIGLERSARIADLWHGYTPSGYTITQGDAFAILPDLVTHWQRQCQAPGDVLIYADPPYLLHTRRDPRPTYDHELSDAQHTALFQLLQSLTCRVVLSHLPCPEYAQAFQHWHTFTFTNATRRGPQLEQVWCNFPPGPQLHEYTYVGDNKRHREQIRRHYGVILRRAALLPPSARVALAAMLEGLNDRVG